MSSIYKNLLPGEKILFRTKKHLFIFFYPFLIMLFSICATTYMSENDILANVMWTPGVVTLLFWSYVGLEYVTSEFVVTNRLMREGFFYRHVAELRLETISQVNIDQSLVGHMLNYGTVSLNAFGAFDAYTMIAQPFVFKKHIYEQVDKLTT